MVDAACVAPAHCSKLSPLFLAAQSSAPLLSASYACNNKTVQLSSPEMSHLEMSIANEASAKEKCGTVVIKLSASAYRFLETAKCPRYNFDEKLHGIS